MSPTLRAVSPRRVLRFDGILCLAMGAGLVLLHDGLAGPTGLPPMFIAVAGGLLVPVGLLILAVAAPATPPRAGVFVVVAGNAAWVAASVVVLVFGLVTPTPLGAALIVLQALAVAAIAVVEVAPLTGMRRVGA
jgi:hypothetical protein